MSEAEILAQRQLDAYNAHDLEAFAACYHEDVVVRSLTTGEELFRGLHALRERYRAMFAEGTVHAELVGRMACGRVVVDHERVTGRGPVFHALAHYAVEHGLITHIWFVRETD